MLSIVGFSYILLHWSLGEGEMRAIIAKSHRHGLHAAEYTQNNTLADSNNQARIALDKLMTTERFDL